MSNNISVNGDGSLEKLKRHGGNIAMAIVVALLAFAIWQYWQKNHSHADLTASDMYTQIQQSQEQIALGLQNPDLAEADRNELLKQQEQLGLQIEQLVSGHSDSIYAWQALMAQAKEQTDDGHYSKAIDSLSQALSVKDIDAGLKAITELRLGQVYLADNQLDAGKKAVSGEMPTGFEASRQELLGDIYVKQNKLDDAKRAYENAWELLRQREENRAILSLKMESLGMQFEPIVVPQMVQMQDLTAHLQAPATDVAMHHVDANAIDANAIDANTVDSDIVDADNEQGGSGLENATQPQ